MVMLHELGIKRRAFVATLANTLKKIEDKKSVSKEENINTTLEDFILKGEAFSGVVKGACSIDEELLNCKLTNIDIKDNEAPLEQ